VSWDDVVARNPEVVVLGVRNIAAVRKLAESRYPETFTRRCCPGSFILMR